MFAFLRDLGKPFGDGLFEAEVDYLVRNEWALTAEDVLWRRSKLGLHVAPSTVKLLTAFLGAVAPSSIRDPSAEVRDATGA